jgi:organic radical activating enzyme
MWNEINHSSQLISIFQSYELPSTVDVVFTGGEPLIYANEPIFIEFLEYLINQKRRVTFETNSTILIDFEKYLVYKECIFALSVKLSNSLEPYKKRVKKEVISSIALNAKESFFKFSIDKDSINAALDEEIRDIISSAPFLDVYCMPVGGNKNSVENNTYALIEYCKAKGYNFSDRLHIRIWDDNKGV